MWYTQSVVDFLYKPDTIVLKGKPRHQLQASDGILNLVHMLC